MQITRLQLSLVRDRIRAAKSRPNTLYAGKFADFDEESILTPEAFENLPFTEKSELRDVYPLGVQAVDDMDDAVFRLMIHGKAAGKRNTSRRHLHSPRPIGVRRAPR